MKHAKPRKKTKAPAAHYGEARANAPTPRTQPAIVDPHPFTVAPLPSIAGPRQKDVDHITARRVTVIERAPDGTTTLRGLDPEGYLAKLDDPCFDPLTDLADLDADGQPIHPDDMPDLDDDGQPIHPDAVPMFDAAAYEASARALDAMEGKARTSAPLPDDHPRHKALPRVDEGEEDDLAADILNHPWIIPAFDAPFDPEQEDPRLVWFLAHNRDAIAAFHGRLRLRWELLISATARLRSPVKTDWTMELTCAHIQRCAWLPLPLAWSLSPRNMQFIAPLLAPLHNNAVALGRPALEVRHDTLKGLRPDILAVCYIFRRLTRGESNYTPRDITPARLVASHGPGEVMPRGMLWEDAPTDGDLLLLRLD